MEMSFGLLFFWIAFLSQKRQPAESRNRTPYLCENYSGWQVL